MSRLKIFFACLIAFLLIFTLSHTALASPESEAHNKKGDEYYDEEKYSEALNEYKAALGSTNNKVKPNRQRLISILPA